LDGPVASWIDKTALEEQRRLLPAGVYARLWLNQWSSAQGDAFTEEAITATIAAEEPLYDAPDNYNLAAIGVDAAAGGRHHAGVVVLLGDRRQRKIRVARVWDLAPPVRLENLKLIILRACEQYGVKFVAADSWQMLAVCETLEGLGLVVKAEQATGNVLVRQAESLLQVMGHDVTGRDAMLETYSDGADGDLLLEDLRGCRVVQKAYGHRLEFAENEWGHSDRLAAMVQALPWILEGMGAPDPGAYDNRIRVAGHVGGDGAMTLYGG
jgi:hypothetical protein